MSERERHATNLYFWQGLGPWAEDGGVAIGGGAGQYASDEGASTLHAGVATRSGHEVDLRGSGVAE